MLTCIGIGEDANLEGVKTSSAGVWLRGEELWSFKLVMLERQKLQTNFVDPTWRTDEPPWPGDDWRRGPALHGPGHAACCTTQFPLVVCFSNELRKLHFL
jgi:hypothetical protein